MAISVGNNTKINSGTTGQTSVNVAAPSGMGTGDLDLIFAMILDSAADRVISVTDDGSAYTSLQDGKADNSGTIMGAVRVFRKSAAASPGTVTVSWTNTAVVHLLLRLSVSGVNLASPIDVQSGTLTEGTDAPSTNPTFTIPALTTTQDGCLAVAWCLWSNALLGGANGSRFAVSGWTANVLNDITSGAATNQIAGAVAWKTVASAGTTGDAVFDPPANADTTARNWIGGMFALAPDGGGGGGASARRRVVVVM